MLFLTIRLYNTKRNIKMYFKFREIKCPLRSIFPQVLMASMVWKIMTISVGVL